MDPEPAAISRISTQFESISRSPHEGEKTEIEDEEPFSLSSSSAVLLGVAIALATVGIPLVAVLTERSIERESMVPTALESDGSKTSLPISFARFSQPSGRDSSRK